MQSEKLLKPLKLRRFWPNHSNIPIPSRMRMQSHASQFSNDSDSVSHKAGLDICQLRSLEHRGWQGSIITGVQSSSGESFDVNIAAATSVRHNKLSAQPSLPEVLWTLCSVNRGAERRCTAGSIGKSLGIDPGWLYSKSSCTASRDAQQL